MLSKKDRFCCYMCLPNAFLLRGCRCGLYILPTLLFITLVYIEYFYQRRRDTAVDFEPMCPGFKSRYFFFYLFFYLFYVFCVIIITVQIQHYCLYSDSPTLLPLMMPRPPARFDFLKLLLSRATYIVLERC